MLESIMRWIIRGITCPEALKTIYWSLVRQLLKFSSIVWSPYLINKLQKIHDRFVRLVGVCMGIRYRQVGYRPTLYRSELANFMGYETRWRVQYVVWLYKLLSSKVDCPALLRNINSLNGSSMRLLSRRTQRCHECCSVWVMQSAENLWLISRQQRSHKKSGQKVVSDYLFSNNGFYNNYY